MKIHLSPATIHDSKDIYDLRQDPIVSKYLFSNVTFTFNEHNAWLQEKLSDNNCMLFVITLCLTNKFAGTIRFDRVSEKQYEISILLSPVFHGQGIGKASLKESLDILKTHISEGTVIARVRPQNIRSMQLFKACGFIEKTNTNNFTLLDYIL